MPDAVLPRLRAVAGVALAVAVPLAAVLAAPASPAAAAAHGPAVAAAEATALRAAAAAGQRVEVLAARTAHSRVYAEPAGQLTYETLVGWQQSPSRWAYAVSDNTTTVDPSLARVGVDPASGKRFRSFFEFPTTGLAGRRVQSASVQMVLEHSWSCRDTYTHMYESDPVSGTPRTSWSTRLQTWLTSAASHTNRTGACGAGQPEQVVNFSGARVAAALQTTVDRGVGTFSVGFCACGPDGTGESAVDRWKRFRPDQARLVVTVEAPTTVPAER